MATALKLNGSSQIMDQITKQIEKAKKDGANMLLPSQILSDVPAMHNITIEYEKMSPIPDKGDVYPKGTSDADKDKFILTKQALMRLCACAGIEWNWAFCGRTDDNSDRDYIAYRMVGAVRKLDGTWYPLQGQYDMDFEVIEEDLRELYIQRSRNWKKPQDQKDAYVRDMTRKELLRKRKHKLALCETGAMLRAIRGLLTIKNSYTRAELEKPFVIARLAFQPDYNDPEIRKQFVAAATQAITGVYGPSAQSPFKPKDQPENYPDIHDIPIENDIPIDGEQEPEEEPEPEFTSEEIDFMNMESEDQMGTLRGMAKKLGKEFLDFKNDPACEGFSRIDFFKKLNALIKNDDIPY